MDEIEDLQKKPRARMDEVARQRPRARTSSKKPRTHVQGKTVIE